MPNRGQFRCFIYKTEKLVKETCFFNKILPCNAKTLSTTGYESFSWNIRLCTVFYSLSENAHGHQCRRESETPSQKKIWLASLTL